VVVLSILRMRRDGGDNSDLRPFEAKYESDRLETLLPVWLLFSCSHFFSFLLLIYFLRRAAT
jgi:hypothetical protein